jgi:hypothetical protein
MDGMLWARRSRCVAPVTRQGTLRVEDARASGREAVASISDHPCMSCYRCRHALASPNGRRQDGHTSCPAIVSSVLCGTQRFGRSASTVSHRSASVRSTLAAMRARATAFLAHDGVPHVFHSRLPYCGRGPAGTGPTPLRSFNTYQRPPSVSRYTRAEFGDDRRIFLAFLGCRLPTIRFVCR